MRAFISYSTRDKKHAGAVSAVLDEINIESFLAHEDLHVSEEWKERILEELKKCEIFVLLLSEAFKSSDWCGQETGVIATRRRVLIIPLSVDETLPYGFISNIQCHRMPSAGIDAQTILTALGRKWPSVAIDGLLKRVQLANSFRGAEKLMEPLVPYFEKLSKDQATRLASMAVENSQIWDAALCRDDYLPKFLKLNRAKIPTSLYRPLKYQIENQHWYRDKRQRQT